MTAPSDNRLRQTDRLKSKAEFDRVYQSDAFAADDMLVVRGTANKLGHPRLGLSISKKVGCAVVRNHWKRLIREAFRTQKGELGGGLDLVVRPRKGAEPDGRRIAASLPQLARRVSRKLNQPSSGTNVRGPKGRRR